MGMIVLLRFPLVLPQACPHTRGDDPNVKYVDFVLDDLSPHAWG